MSQSLLDKMLGRNHAHVSHRLKGQKRLPNETYDEYKKRLRKEQQLVESYLQGDMVWCAKALHEHNFGVDAQGNPITMFTVDEQKSKGTYVKKRHGIIKSDRRM